jgi:general secretion pathway protein G
MKIRAQISNGFTLIELMVAMAIIALLLSIVTPRYFHSVSKAEEAVLRQDLASLRETLDKYHADTGKYPDVLEDIVTKKYLLKVPVDPVTESAATWIMIPPPNTEKGLISNIKSGALGISLDGTAYVDW